MNDQTESVNYKINFLLELFPKGDFDYLKTKAEQFALDESSFANFVSDALTTNSVPVSTKAQNENPTGSELNQTFDLQSFFEACPDPFNYFESVERTETQKNLLLELMKDRFRNVELNTIVDIASRYNFNLLHCCYFLRKIPSEHFLPVFRPDSEINLNAAKNNRLFQLEVFLLDHEEEVRQYTMAQNEIRSQAVQMGQTLTCECCYSDDILADEVVTCSKAHIFCKTCVKRSVNIQIGYSRLEFPCLAECTTGNFPLNTIKQLLDDKSFRKLAARIQESEVLEADISGLIQCQKCEYAAIADDSTIVFRCLKCAYSFCLKCNKEDHAPLKCNETVQEDMQKQTRKRSEEFETSKVVRKCARCKKAFVKIDGCNKITCVCGNTICYICGASGIDYNHINGGCYGMNMLQ